MPHPAGDHDGLVVAALHRAVGTDIARVVAHQQLVLAEVAQQVGPAELVVEGGAAQRPLGHDLQRAGHVLRLAARLVGQAVPELADGEAGQAGLGARAAAGGALVADLAAGAGAGAREGADGRGVVVGLHLHQHVAQGTLFLIAGCARHAWARGHFGLKNLDLVACHHGGVVAVGHHRMARLLLVGVADHAEQALVLRHAVDGEVGVEDLVAAVLAVGLGEHHQLHIGRVAAQPGEGFHQVVDLVRRQRQAPVAVGPLQRGLAAGQHVHMGQRLGVQLGEQRGGIVPRSQHALGHAVVQQRGDGGKLIFR